MTKSILPVSILVLAAVFVTVSVVHADTFTFATAPGATDSGGNPVSAEAIFTTSVSTVTLELINLLVNPKEVGQNISDISFKLNTGTSASLTSSSGHERTVISGGTFSDGSVVAAGWVRSGTPTAGLTLDDLTGSGHAGPKHTIIGDPGGGGTYSNANASIAGNGPHNPFLLGDLANPVVFNLSLVGASGTVTVFDVVFSFGTNSEIRDDVPGSPVPEPGILILLGIAMAVVGVASRYVRKI